MGLPGLIFAGKFPADMIQKTLLVLSILLGMFTCYSQEEVTSANGGERLASFLERFEKSDLNGDGVLTVDEMHDFLDSKIKDGAKSVKTKRQEGEKRSLKNLSSRVYLAIFLKESPNTDLNKDGVLTKEELLTYIKAQRKIINENGEKVPAPPRQSVAVLQ